MPHSGGPEPDELIKNELETLRFLSTELPAHLSNKFQELANKASTAYAAGCRVRSSFSFESFVDCNLPDSQFKNLRLYFGGEVRADKKKYERTSYYLAVCRGCNEDYPVLRKFHFDFITRDTKVKRNQHPAFHIQYPGELSPGLKDAGFNDNDLDYIATKFSLPRIFFMPTTFAILINLIVKEFFYWDHDVIKFFSRSEWKKLVKKDEDLILSPFYEGVTKFIKDTKNKETNKLLTTDYFYVGQVSH